MLIPPVQLKRTKDTSSLTLSIERIAQSNKAKQNSKSAFSSPNDSPSEGEEDETDIALKSSKSLKDLLGGMFNATGGHKQAFGVSDVEKFIIDQIISLQTKYEEISRDLQRETEKIKSQKNELVALQRISVARSLSVISWFWSFYGENAL